MWDTAGQENFDKIRILSYENTKCFIVCFSVVDGVSFSNVKNLWVEEVRQHQPSAKILLVGTKSDLRGKNGNGSGDGSKRGEEVALRKISRLVQREGLDDYVETSALNGVEDVDKVFKAAIRVAIGSNTVATGRTPAETLLPIPISPNYGVAFASNSRTHWRI